MIRRLPNIFFDIITPRYKREFRILESRSNFNIHRIGPGSKISKILFPVLGFFKAGKLMGINSYDAVHSYQASYAGGAAYLTKIFYPRLPFILTMQEGKKLDKQSSLLNWFRRIIIKKADIVTVISKYLEDFVSKCSKNKKIFLIPNGVDLKKFQITNDKLQPGFDFKEQDNRTIITVSRLVPKNGVSDLIKALKILNTNYDTQNTKLLIIGDGPQREELFVLTNDLGLKDSVEFAGSVPNDDIYEYLAPASVFVRPSLSEGLGTAFLEAMAVGVPIVGTPIGGIKDFLVDKETGLFCRVEDPADIAEKIRMILFDNNLRGKLITNGRKLVEEKYTWDKIAVKFRNIYESV